MLRSSVAPLAVMLLVAVSSPALADKGDVAGAKDYPGIGRFAGSVITGYEVKDFDATRLQAAPFKNGTATDERKPEGRITRIAYKTGPGPSIVEVSRNFETQLKKAGFDTGASVTPITPIMTAKAVEFSTRLFDEGVFALALGFPTVPRGKERLRTIVTAGHTLKDLEFAVEKFKKVGKELGII